MPHFSLDFYYKYSIEINKSRTKRRSSMFDFTFEPALDMLSFSKNIFISFDTLAAAHNTQILLA